MPVPGSATTTGPGDRLTLDVDDPAHAGSNRARSSGLRRARSSRRPARPGSGREALGLDRDDRRAGVAVLQRELAPLVRRPSRRTRRPQVLGAEEGPGPSRPAGPCASTTRPVTVRPFLRTITLSRLRDAGCRSPLILGCSTFAQSSARSFGATSSRHRPWASVLELPSVKTEFVPSYSVGGAWTSTVAPSIGWPASSLTIPPIVVPGSNRSSFIGRQLDRVPLVIPDDVDRHELWRAGGEPELMDGRGSRATRSPPCRLRRS